MDDTSKLLPHLEALARLRLPETERDRLSRDLVQIIRFVGQIVENDDDTKPSPHAFGPPASPRRNDDPIPGLLHEAALALSPAARPDFFTVPPLRDAGATGAGTGVRADDRPPTPVAREQGGPLRGARASAGTGIARLTLHEALAAQRTGDVSPAEVADQLAVAVARQNRVLRAYTWLSPAGEPADAAGPADATLSPGADAPLGGLGYALKANIASRAGPTDCASRLLAGYRAPYDATVVARLREAGARLVGKTNMDEFGMGSSTEHSAHGPTCNPWRPDRVPGGSSGGSAAAVAADLAFFALGHDTGGSVRQPAHCCGVVGLKPTYGRVSRYGLVAFASSLDVIGTLTKDVRDAALVYSRIAGHDPRDATSVDAPVGDPLGAVARPARGLRVGVPWRLLESGLAPDVASDFRATLAELRGQRIEIVDVDLPAATHAVAAYAVICTAEASSNLARYDGVRYGARATGPRAARSWQAMVEATRAEGFGAEVKRRILLGTFVLSEGYREAYYARALRARARIAAEFARAFDVCDAIALPTAPTTAFALGEKLHDPLQMYLSDVFTVPASLAGLPAITVPTGIDRDGLPLSIQLVAPALKEERLLTLAAAVEKARGFRALKEAAWRGR